jgi:uncharacterized protein (DUF305 family)
MPKPKELPVKLTLMKTVLTSATIIVSSLTLVGCATQHSSMMGGDGMMHQSTTSQFSGADIMFAQMMIPHHQQAVDMGVLAKTRATDPKVRELAAKIMGEQAPQIEQMKGWLKTANASMDMGHMMGGGGMLTDAEMTTLESASGAEFDRLYLTGMIAHHEGAIHMASMVNDSRNSEVMALGNAIVSSQTQEIAYMKSLLAGL